MKIRQKNRCTFIHFCWPHALLPCFSQAVVQLKKNQLMREREQLQLWTNMFQ